MKISIHANFHVCFSFSFHYNALFVLITISNTRSKRVNKNITRQCTQFFLLVGRSVSISVRTFSLELWLWWIPNVDMWVCATGAQHSKSLEWHCERTACLWGEAKCTVCAFSVKAESGGYQN